ncbi:hypothetical protein LWI29_021921 [Acer saccharum]|uniref:S-acyltransferase n=1 Tax=Acer saccharum TaxID=4024 RepID=A0AA39RHE8_ACESA|nr:hypothetical protein LWI29_021921 [Acer saccharum]
MADLANEQSHTSEHVVTMIEKDNEPTCWGCGLHLLLPSYAPTFKCGWCGAITGQHVWKHESKCFRWRRLRDRCFVCFLLVFMFFVIGGGIWAMHPVVFSFSSLSGIFHSIIAILLSISTVSTFSLVSFRCAGTQPNILWGSYPLVGKGDLVNYTFCHYCSKPKSPRTHHCRTCGVCVLDMDHHCPFIGNCVGAGNHQHFIAFLISAVVSTIYIAIMKKQRRRRLITVSTSDGKWHGNWNSDYRVSLQDLGLQDLVEVEVEVDHPLVSVNLCVQKHASFGFSVDGRIITSFTRKCTNCCSPYCRQIDANFNVWILQSREENGTINALPEIGGDPSLRNEADLDSLVQETIRLATTVKDTCSESCEKSEPTMHYIGPQNTASVHKRWGRLLELKNANL